MHEWSSGSKQQRKLECGYTSVVILQLQLWWGCSNSLRFRGMFDMHFTQSVSVHAVPTRIDGGHKVLLGGSSCLAVDNLPSQGRGQGGGWP
jgi:hypothetical protein